MAGGSAPARNYRGLLRVHVLFGLRICTSVAPRTSPEASAGRLLELGCSSGYRANRQFPGRDFHPLAFETQEVSLRLSSHQSSFRVALPAKRVSVAGFAYLAMLSPEQARAIERAAGPSLLQ